MKSSSAFLRTALLLLACCCGGVRRGVRASEVACEVEGDLYTQEGCTLDLLPDATLQEMLLLRGYDGSEAERDVVIEALAELLLYEMEEAEWMAAEAEREAAAKSEGDPEPVLSELVDEVTEDDTEGEVELAEVDEVHDLPYPYGYENEPEYAAPGATTETKKNGASEDDFEREDSSFLGFISDLGREVGAQMQRDAKMLSKLLPPPVQEALATGGKVFGATLLPAAKEAVRYAGFFGRGLIKSSKFAIEKIGPKVKDALQAVKDKRQQGQQEQEQAQGYGDGQQVPGA